MRLSPNYAGLGCVPLVFEIPDYRIDGGFRGFEAAEAAEGLEPLHVRPAIRAGVHVLESGVVQQFFVRDVIGEFAER